MVRRSDSPLLLVFMVSALALSACDGDTPEDPEDASPDTGMTTGDPDMPEDMPDDPEDASMDAGVDMPEDMPPAGPPVVSLAITPDVVTEDPASEVTFTFTLDRDPPDGGTRVYLLGDVPQALSQLNLFALRTDPVANDAPVGDLDFSGFTLLMESREVSVITRGFADGEAEDPVEVTFTIVPFEDVAWGMLPVDNEPAAAPYVVGSPDTATLTLKDTPDDGTMDPPDYDPALERVPARIVHLSPGAGALDVCARVEGFRWIGPVAEGAGVSEGIDFGASTGFVDLPLGTDRVRLVDASADSCDTPLAGTSDLEIAALTTMSRTSIAIAGEGAGIEAFATEQLPQTPDAARLYAHVVHAIKGAPSVVVTQGPCTSGEPPMANVAVAFTSFAFKEQGRINMFFESPTVPEAFRPFYFSSAPTPGENTFTTINGVCEATPEQDAVLERSVTYATGGVTTLFASGTAAQPVLVQCTDVAPGGCAIVEE